MLFTISVARQRPLVLALAVAALFVTPLPTSAQSSIPAAVMPPAKAKAAASVTRATAKEARAMLARAVALLTSQAEAAAYSAFDDRHGEFIRKDLYVFVVGLDGMMYAHGGSPEGLVGLQVIDLRDAAGKSLIREIVDIAREQGRGSVEYVWLNRANNRVENKTTFFEKVGERIVAVGYYTPRSSAEEARAFLDQAAAEMRSIGPAAAFAAFNDRKGVFVRDDLYVFAVGIDDYRFHAMGATPGLTGSDVRDLRDAAGKPIIQEMVALAREKGAGEVDYVWRNPANNKVENKRSFIRRVDAYLLGVGYYSR